MQRFWLTYKSRISSQTNLELVAGVENLFDEYPDRNPGAGAYGMTYPEDSPFGL